MGSKAQEWFRSALFFRHFLFQLHNARPRKRFSVDPYAFSFYCYRYARWPCYSSYLLPLYKHKLVDSEFFSPDLLKNNWVRYFSENENCKLDTIRPKSVSTPIIFPFEKNNGFCKLPLALFLNQSNLQHKYELLQSWKLKESLRKNQHFFCRSSGKLSRSLSFPVDIIYLEMSSAEKSFLPMVCPTLPLLHNFFPRR